jgi:putative toxin-antitoxin system antitoxin component (TIGR02293 family)
MKKNDEKTSSFSIYDWLEKPGLRTPASKNLTYQEINSDTVSQVNEVGVYSDLALLKNEAVFVSNQEQLYSDYHVKILPMLKPQMIHPEFFMNNHSKAMMAQNGISKVSFEHFKSRAGLDYNQLAILLSVARNTLINKKGDETFDVNISEKLISLAEVYTHGFDVFGSEEKFKKWLNVPNRALGMVTPFSLLQTQFGRQEVQNVLGRIEWGVYS